MDDEAVVSTFRTYLENNPDASPALAAIETLQDVVRKDNSPTVAGFRATLHHAKDVLVQTADTTVTCVTSACTLFVRHVTLHIGEAGDWKEVVLQQGDLLIEKARHMRQSSAAKAVRFIRDGVTVFTLGRSRVLQSVFKQAVKQKKRFRVFVAESLPSGLGVEMAKALKANDVDVTLIPDAAVAQTMNDVDVVMTGAEAVVENGGIINTVGTYQAALAAAALNKPVYAACETLKFIQLYPLSQSDVPHKQVPLPLSQDTQIATRSPAYDFTPPQYIKLLFTDIGVLTPAAVSDTLMNLYV